MGSEAPDPLRATLLELIAPARLGSEIEGGFVVVDVSTELGPRILLARNGAEVIVEVSALNQGLRHAAATQRLALAYRGAATTSAEGLAACRALASVVAVNEARVLAAARGGDEPRVREVAVERALEPMGSFAALSPYVGCLIGCRYCYAQGRLHAARNLMGLAAVPWGSWVDARTNIAELLASELGRARQLPIKFCPIVSDPYQAVESRYRLTRQCLEVLAAASDPPPTLVLTRSTLILDDLPLLARLPRAWAGVSLPSLDSEVLRHFEPRAAGATARLEVLARARALGLSTVAVVQPALPGPLEALADAIAAHADSVHVGGLDGEQGASADFDDPRFDAARTSQWQRERTAALRAALLQRGVALWRGELPPELEVAG